MGKDNIFMPLKYKRRFQRWDADKCKAILLAMFDYKETGEANVPEEYQDAFEAIRDDMDIIEAAYKRRCEINAENGSKGGRPKKTEKSEKTEWVFAKPKKALREEKKREEKKRETSRVVEHGDLPFYPLKEFLP